VIIAIGVARPSADPHRSVVAQLDRSSRDIVRPEIEGPAAGQVKAGMMPVAGQNPVLYRAAVKRKTEVRATVIERVEATLIVHDEQWAGAATEDGHAFGLQLLQSPDADPVFGRGFGTRLEHRAGPPARALTAVRRSSPIATVSAAA
jgi:hypothetical protein